MFIFIVIFLVLVAVGGYFYLQQVRKTAAKTEAETTETASPDAVTTDAVTTDAAKTDAVTTDATKTDATKTDATKTDATKTDAVTTQVTTTQATPTETAAAAAASSSVASNSSAPIVVIPGAGSEVSAVTTSPSPSIGTPVTTPSSSPAPQSTVDKLKQKLKDEQAAFAAKSNKDKAKTVALGAAVLATGGIGLAAVAASRLLPTATKDAIKQKADEAKNKVSSFFRRR